MKIKATNDITAQAKSIQECIDIFSNKFKELQSKIDTIPTFWEGKDATSFIGKFRDEIFPELTKYQNSFQNYREYLSKVYNVYSALEEDYDKEIS